MSNSNLSCRKCGHQISARFCQSCGADSQCANCGASLQGEFCGSCGTASGTVRDQTSKPAPLLTYSKRPGLRPAVAAWLMAVLWAAAAGALAMFFIVLSVRSKMELTLDPDRTYESFDRWQAAMNQLKGLTSWVMIFAGIVFVLFLLWGNFASKAASGLAPENRKWSPGWAVGAWFIPIASVIFPKIVLNETERIASAPRYGGRVVSDWRESGRLSPIGRIWWATFIGASFLFFLGNPMAVEDFRDPWHGLDPGAGDQQHFVYLVLLFAYGLAAIGSVAGAFYVQRVSRRLSPNSLTIDDPR